ncbi:MAG: inositol-3-phosphate synthase [Isosphaeraceae bacterium]
MKRRRVGLWLIGAFGGVGTTITLGLSAIARGLSPTTGLVTALPLFDGLDLPEPGDFVVGGHEIRQTSFLASAEEFLSGSRVFDRSVVDACRGELEAATARVRPGTKFGTNATIGRLGDWADPTPPRTAADVVDRLAKDMDDFARSEHVDHLIVLNVSSTEAPASIPAELLLGGDLDLLGLLGRATPDFLPASSLYAIAAVRSGHTYLNFTPSLGASLPSIAGLAESTGSLLGGKDGKTGETLMKTVLAPMFAHRNLKVTSWVGHNIFGNRDGLVLDDPANKAAKVRTKDVVIHEILGYKPNTLVTIEYLPDMGDWKTAWDHIHFQGFLGTPMTLQFTWQGCDSLLAAPLGIDLARLADLEKRRGRKGLMKHLASFFKAPEGAPTNDFFEQFRTLVDYVAQVKAGA